MSCWPEYVRHSGYSEEPGGLTRLIAVVEAVERFRDGADPAGFPLVEVGCGTGNLALPLASLGYPVLGIDVDAASIDEASRRNRFENAQFESMDAVRLSTGSRRIVVLSEVLEHVEQPVSLLKTLHAVLIPGGLAVVTVPNGYGPWEAMNFAKKGAARIGLGGAIRALKSVFGYGKTSLQSLNPDLEHLQFFTRRSLAKAVEEGGFDVVRWSNLSFLVGCFPVSWIWRRFRGIERLDAGAGRLLPGLLVSGWLLQLARR
ncbi:MAG: class I SAM-dependent methyltransferase [Candidatus Riflebacteria bacterium]|nr:class I SAM-dependent methyltransferase [Candidatus Riflebacteria bacterium]